MSTSLLVRAKEALDRKNRLEKAKQLLQKQEVAVAVGGVATLTTSAQAAFIDIKFGKNGEQAKVLKVVPVNLLAGLPFAATAFFLTKYPALAAGMAGEGFGLMNNGLYRLWLDLHAKHEAEKAAQSGAPATP